MRKKSSGNSFKKRKWTWLAGTNCIFIWLEARDEGGMRGPSSLNLPTLLGRPVWRAYLPSDHIGLEGKRLQLQPRSPLGVVWFGEASKPDWALSWACLNLVYPDWHFTRCQREDTGTLICVLTWPAVLTPLNKTWSYYYVLLLHAIVYYHNHYNTDYAWYSVQIWVIHSAYAHKFTRFYRFTLAITNLMV